MYIKAYGLLAVVILGLVPLVLFSVGRPLRPVHFSLNSHYELCSCLFYYNRFSWLLTCFAVCQHLPFHLSLHPRPCPIWLPYLLPRHINNAISLIQIYITGYCTYRLQEGS